MLQVRRDLRLGKIGYYTPPPCHTYSSLYHDYFLLLCLPSDNVQDELQTLFTHKHSRQKETTEIKGIYSVI